MLKIIDLGLCDYQETRDLQKELQQKLIAGDPDDYLIICSHTAVITRGKSSKENQILASEAELEAQKISVIEVERGGETTYHDPGQLILYPIINLSRHKKDVAWYLRQLEEVIILSLQEFGVRGLRIQGKTGVWIGSGGGFPDRKIASLGVRISRWCTMHGLAVNIYNSDKFKVIVPCGIDGVMMTDLITETRVDSQLSVDLFVKFQDSIVANFQRVFKSPELPKL